MDIKSFDWRSLQRYFGPQAANDLNDFLEKMPQMAGQTVLVAAGIAWASAGALGLYTTIEMKSMTGLRAELADTKALKPVVPIIKNVPVPPTEIQEFSKDLGQLYPALTIKQQGASILISSNTTANFGQFREAVGHVQNGGSGWRVSMEKFCVGRECAKDKLAALLKINKVSVESRVKEDK